MPEDVPANLRLDHAVIAVADLAAAMADYEALGFTVRFGGEHPGRRTHNALIYFADGSYLELIAERLELPPTDDERENWIRMAPVREGSILLTYALRTEDLAATIAACARRSLTLEGPRAGARLRPDGKRIAWRSAAAANINLPFIIEDVSARALRILDAEADTDACQRRVGCAAGRVAGGGCRENRGGICVFARANGGADRRDGPLHAGRGGNSNPPAG